MQRLARSARLPHAIERIATEKNLFFKFLHIWIQSSKPFDAEIKHMTRNPTISTPIQDFLSTHPTLYCSLAREKPETIQVFHVDTTSLQQNRYDRRYTFEPHATTTRSKRGENPGAGKPTRHGCSSGAVLPYAAWDNLLDIDIIKNSYLMVDLFFILSGFVIYTVYSPKSIRPMTFTVFSS